MKILALEPYYGGSHKAFLDGWINLSRHDWTVLTLPSSKWKWRMRHSAITLAEETAKRLKDGDRWDIVFCSDMLGLAEFKGLVDVNVRNLPAVVYFHENQLTYPVRITAERDDHFALTNLTTCLAADQIWFNSDYHRQTFLKAIPEFLGKMPDYQMTHLVDQIAEKSTVMSPGIEMPPPRPLRKEGPLHIIWAARWEYDKNPDTFFDAMRQLRRERLPFRISIIGQQFRGLPDIFEQAKEKFKNEIVTWGYQNSRKSYYAALHQADVIVSTADHEFFGITILEAIAAGIYPLLPDRLAYPEILRAVTDNKDFFYDGTVEDMVQKLIKLNQGIDSKGTRNDKILKLNQIIPPYLWQNKVPVMDNMLQEMMSG
jgi:glycosyltransferase involved in cell wall biosynthesis